MSASTNPTLTKQEVAREMKVCLRTVEGWLKQRRLTYLKIGKSVRITREALESLKETFAVQAIR